MRWKYKAMSTHRMFTINAYKAILYSGPGSILLNRPLIKIKPGSSFILNWILLIAGCLFFTITSAQTNSANVNFQMNFPQGVYKSTYPRTATGMLIRVLHGSKTTPSLAWGGEVGILQVSTAFDRYPGYYHNNYHDYYVSAGNYIFSFAPLLRWNLFNFNHKGNVFIDLTTGTNIFSTSVGITHDEGYDILTNSARTKTDSSFTHDAWVLRAGAGLGVNIPLSKKGNLAWSFKCSWLYGGRAFYFSHPEVTDLQITIVPKASGTSMLLAETGFSFKAFNKKSHKQVNP